MVSEYVTGHEDRLHSSSQTIASATATIHSCLIYRVALLWLRATLSVTLDVQPVLPVGSPCVVWKFQRPRSDDTQGPYRIHLSE